MNGPGKGDITKNVHYLERKKVEFTWSLYVGIDI